MDNKIKSIVISGGGHTFVTFYGIIKESREQKFWNIENIESLYGTSAGAMCCLLISLNIDPEVLDNYLMKRPWEKVFNVNMESFLSIVTSFGLLNKKSIYEFFTPLFETKEIPIDITFKDFYEINKIDLNIYTSELNKFESIKFSHETYPDWKVLDALYTSLSIPILFSPIIIDNNCYIDGGFLMDFPINDSLKKYKENEIFAIKKNTNRTDENKITDYSNVFNFLYSLLKQSLHNPIIQQNSNMKNVLIVEEDSLTFEKILNVISSQELRYKMTSEGQERFKAFYKDFSSSC